MSSHFWQKIESDVERREQWHNKIDIEANRRQVCMENSVQ